MKVNFFLFIFFVLISLSNAYPCANADSCNYAPCNTGAKALICNGHSMRLLYGNRDYFNYGYTWQYGDGCYRLSSGGADQHCHDPCPSSCPTGNYLNIGFSPSSLYIPNATCLCTPCLSCAAGQYPSTPCTLNSNAACSSCPAGKFSSAGQTACTDCNAGTYATGIGMTSSDACISCGTNVYSNTPGATSVASCITCPPG
jgi:hypothetical protein